MAAKKKKPFLILLVVLIISAAAYFFLFTNSPVKHRLYYTREKYVQVKKELASRNTLLKTEYKKSTTTSAKQQLLNKARQQFHASLTDQLFPFWYGTRWKFTGTTEVPGEGAIACGYFVTTLLRDAGYKLDRVRLAQCSSEEMIKSLVSEDLITRYSSRPLKEFCDDVKKKGEGMYVIGLDNHTGFISCQNGEVYFIHSSGTYPWAVVKEKAIESGVLKKSKYKVLGALSKSNVFIKKWMGV